MNTMIKNERITWDDYFLEIANTTSPRATCDRGRSGCVIVRDNQILATGYVGSPIGLPHCDDEGHLFEEKITASGTSKHCIRTVHAEQNAICQAAKRGISIKGATLYSTMTPCRTCAMLIINCEIKHILCNKRYHAGEESEKMFVQSGIPIEFKYDEIQLYE